ncbi:uncharacterized protein, partial [Prorops nasuta]|uniref:uncharacterized protein n=1 Tax=Prorops nasuta TaxID=863751 RepID=UPI0034CD919A
QQQTRSSGDGKFLAHPSNTAIKLSPGHHSLPRKKPALDSRNSTTLPPPGQFQRGQLLRRSCLSPTTQYQHQSQQQQQHHHHPHQLRQDSLHFEYFVPRSVSEFNLAAAAVREMAVPPPPSATMRATSTMTPPLTGPTCTNFLGQTRLLVDSSATRSREKMVTFEDEGNCPGSTPTRKSLAIDNVFM